MQNAAVRRLGVAGVTTTVMTSTLTGLVAGRADERTPSTTRRQALSVVTLVVGAALGAVAVRTAGPRWTLVAVTALACVVAVTALSTLTRTHIQFSCAGKLDNLD
jgi:uncharacterized membrane protein YoaK (UPF0700 family)